MTAQFGHHQLHNRYRFEGTVILTTPLRISSGRAGDTSDAPLIRTRDGLPYLPGSSLRGVLRTAVERILAAVGESADLTSCVLFSDTDCNARARTFQSDQLDNASEEDRDKDKKLLTFAEGLCDVCKLFGATIYASRLVIEDAYPCEPKDALMPHEIIRDGVGIDRDTGTAHEGVKFNYEVLEPGPTFRLRMQIENLTVPDQKILQCLRGLLTEGLYVGGKQAAGLGGIRLKEGLAVHGFTSPQALWDALQKNTSPMRGLQWEEIQPC
jgi:CRISPR-associated protein Csm3